MLGGAIADDNREVRLNVLRSIGKVSSHLKQKGEQPIDAATQKQLQQGADRARADGADAAESVVAAATLLRMGDDSRKDKLKQGLAADDPEIKALAIEEATADPELNKSGLTALLAGQRCSRCASRCLRAGRSGQQRRSAGAARRAQGRWRQRLQSLRLPQEARRRSGAAQGSEKLLAVDDAEVRASIVETSASLPVKDALPVLQRAAKDPAGAVRQKVIEVIAGWAPADGSASGLPIIRGLSDDSDVVVACAPATCWPSCCRRRRPSPSIRRESGEAGAEAPAADRCPAAAGDMAGGSAVDPGRGDRHEAAGSGRAGRSAGASRSCSACAPRPGGPSQSSDDTPS